LLSRECAPQVLMGFLGEDMTQSMLPLMINFEAKSISKQFPALKETMEKRYGFCTAVYVLLRCAALLAALCRKRTLLRPM
jgi:hypothetical protein